jgi:hypothetical protein
MTLTKRPMNPRSHVAKQHILLWRSRAIASLQRIRSSRIYAIHEETPAPPHGKKPHRIRK